MMDQRAAKFGQEIADLAKQNTEELKNKIKSTANQFLIRIVEGNEEIKTAQEGLTTIEGR